MVKPVGQCAGAVHGEALVQDMEGHVLKTVVVQCHLEGGNENNNFFMAAPA